MTAHDRIATALYQAGNLRAPVLGLPPPTCVQLQAGTTDSHSSWRFRATTTTGEQYEFGTLDSLQEWVRFFARFDCHVILTRIERRQDGAGEWEAHGPPLNPAREPVWWQYRITTTTGETFDFFTSWAQVQQFIREGSTRYPGITAGRVERRRGPGAWRRYDPNGTQVT